MTRLPSPPVRRPAPALALAWVAIATFTLLTSGVRASAQDRGRGRDRERDPAPERQGFKMVSPNFLLYGNGRTAEARRLLRDLETFRHVVSRFLGLTNVQRRPALVFLFRDDASFQPFKPRHNGQPAPVSGFHSEDPMDYAIALSRQNRDTATMRVLYHEYTHLLTARQFRHAPLWLHEGVAEVFSSFESDGDRFDIGIALTNHAFHLQRHPPLAVRALLPITRDSPDYNEQQRAGSFYASSWLLAHYLLFARRGFESNVVARYATACATTTNQFLAFQSAFGVSHLDLDSALNAYVRGGSYTIVRQSYPDLDVARSREMPLSPGEWDYALGRLLQLTRQDDPARERLLAASRAAPNDPRPFEALTLLAWRHGDRPAMRGFIAKALANDSRDAFLHFLAGDAAYLELQRLRALTGQPPTPDSLAEGRQHCQRAIELDPWLAPAHHLLGVYTLVEHPATPALAAHHVQKALECDPLFKPAWLTAASLAAAQGNFGQARLILANLLAGPITEDLRAAARQVATEIERRLGNPRSPNPPTPNPQRPP